MGEKGAKQSSDGAIAAEALVADLASLGEVSARKMFGGFGVFHESTMFALIDSAGVCFLRADDQTSSDFEQAGVERHGRMPYWQIPSDVRSNDAELIRWARSALEAATRAKG